MNKIIYVLIAVILVSSCGVSSDNTPKEDGAVVYEVRVEFNWTDTNNPNSLGEFPEYSQFSPMFCTTHKDDKSFYMEEEKSSEGIKNVIRRKELGTLRREIDDQFSADNVYRMLIAIGPHRNKGNKVIGTIHAKDDYEFFSAFSVIVPSPDWFIGKRNINLKDNKGNWRTTITEDLRGYDAGIDSGKTFTDINNKPTVPPDVIKIFTGNDNIVFATLILTKKQ